MAVTVSFRPLVLAWLALAFIVFTHPCPSGSTHLKMVHKFSRHPPSFPGDLSDMEMTRLLLDHDNRRAEGHHYRGSDSEGGGRRSGSIVQPRLKLSPIYANYLLEIGIGTPPTPHILKFDTSSDITWLQCLPCQHCFTNPGPIYDPSTSSSYVANTCLPDEKHCLNDVTTYEIKYPEGSTTFGLESWETLWFPSADGRKLVPVEEVPFLCAKRQSGFGIAPGFEGVAAFRYAPNHWQAAFSGGKFSYCLRNESSTCEQLGRLRLGDEAVLSGPGVQRVPMLVGKDSTFYYLGLTDVSVAGRKVGFMLGTFLRPKTPGFYIDAGASFTRFADGGAYDRVAAAFQTYFTGFGLKERPDEKFPCYESKKGFSLNPNMTFHFGNEVEFVVPSWNVVKVFPEGYFCLLLTKGNVNVWGAVQQRDYRISYDTSGNELAFIPADCDRVL